MTGKPDLTGSLLDLWAEDRCSENRYRDDGIMKCRFCPGVRPGGRGDKKQQIGSEREGKCA